MAITLESAKAYLRVDGTYDDSLITQCIAAARAHMDAAVDDFDTRYGNDSKFAALADVVMYALITEMYTNRDARNDNRQSLPYIVRSMITQLQNHPEEGG